MVCLGRPHHFKFFKDCLPQIVLGPFLNILTHIFFARYSIFLKTFQAFTFPKNFFQGKDTHTSGNIENVLESEKKILTVIKLDMYLQKPQQFIYLFILSLKLINIQNLHMQ